MSVVRLSMRQCDSAAGILRAGTRLNCGEGNESTVMSVTDPECGA